MPPDQTASTPRNFAHLRLGAPVRPETCRRSVVSDGKFYPNVMTWSRPSCNRRYKGLQAVTPAPVNRPCSRAVFRLVPSRKERTMKTNKFRLLSIASLAASALVRAAPVAGARRLSLRPCPLRRSVFRAARPSRRGRAPVVVYRGARSTMRRPPSTTRARVSRVLRSAAVSCAECRGHGRRRDRRRGDRRHRQPRAGPARSLAGSVIGAVLGSGLRALESSV